MGKKRKQEKSEEEIRRKIKKLTEKLEKTTNKNTAETNPPEEVTNSSLSDMAYDWTPYCDPFSLDQCEASMPYLDSPQPDQPRTASPEVTVTRTAPPPLSPPPPVSPARPPSPLPGTSAAEEATEELQLGDEILQLLGDAPKEDTTLGPPIHNDVARRWQNILAKGLPKDVKDSLLKAYLIPSNCDLLLTPNLNPEVRAALPEPLVKRDAILSNKQKQLGVALSALSAVTQMIISNESSKEKILKPLSDACRILCDNHYVDTRTRRNFIISSINVNLKDTLIETARDKFLFGENISEKLKTAKAIQQSGNALKNAQKPRFQRPNPTQTSSRGRLNYLPQHRKVVIKESDGRRAQYPAPHPSSYPAPYPAPYPPPYAAHRQPTSSNTRRPLDRPPPPPKPQTSRRR